MFTKEISSTEVRKWRLWEFSQPGAGSGKLQTGRVFPAYTSPLIALSDCSFLILMIRSTLVQGSIFTPFSLSLSLPIHDDKESSGAAVLAKPQSKRASGPLVCSWGPGQCCFVLFSSSVRGLGAMEPLDRRRGSGLSGVPWQLTYVGRAQPVKQAVLMHIQLLIKCKLIM